ncbi:type III polyketide synthase [Propylenella binzhouense]|uniref:Type III polyketide synthase n=1 Tax=Propylenella binzhouense TaxID=2555902 RepID=A0A964T9F4_9HYPH|nr:type III polyketide synthase [Propylenella binzhouense]MYZ50219.1 type III polyketide synthase [Propylenella binzhouense]
MLGRRGSDGDAGPAPARAHARPDAGAGQGARLLGLATVVPPNALDQERVLLEAIDRFGLTAVQAAQCGAIFRNTGISCRYSARDFPWFRGSQDWASRSSAYLEGASDLFLRAAGAALAQSGIDPGAVDTVVTVSSTGIATPSLEARVHGTLGLRPDVRRVPVFGLGCAGGASGLSLATRLAAAEPGSTVLLVVVELCTLAFRSDAASKSNIVATALFGDGAAAAVVRAGDGAGGILQLERSGEHLWPDTLDVMGWDVDPVGFSAIFSKSIPDLVTERLRPAAEAFLAAGGRRLEEIEHYVFHPGGAKVVEALERTFGLAQGSLSCERDVLRRFGNMSAPTVLFVLERALAEMRGGPGLLVALGPGFTASFVGFSA